MNQLSKQPKCPFHCTRSTGGLSGTQKRVDMVLIEEGEGRYTFECPECTYIKIIKK